MRSFDFSKPSGPPIPPELSHLTPDEIISMAETSLDDAGAKVVGIMMGKIPVTDLNEDDLSMILASLGAMRVMADDARRAPDEGRF